MLVLLLNAVDVQHLFTVSCEHLLDILPGQFNYKCTLPRKWREVFSRIYVINIYIR